MSNELKLLNNWLINSGIQNNVDPDKGGFNAWYSLKNKSYPFIYSEIIVTGEPSERSYLKGATTILFGHSFNDVRCISSIINIGFEQSLLSPENDLFKKAR